jgi:hypothetical protein
MSEVKVQFSVGGMTFSGEGDQVWVEKQIDKLIEKAPALMTIVASSVDTSGKGAGSGGGGGGSSPGTLASFIAAAGGGSNQVRRFLATAEWLHRKGNKRLTTADVSKALLDNSQKKLSNPAECLNQNVGKGHCEKDGKQFYVTDDGRALLTVKS